jgi:hypothetical protein
VDMTDLLGIDADAEEEEGDAQPAGKGQKKGGKKAKSMRLSASGGNALGQSTLPSLLLSCFPAGSQASKLTYVLGIFICQDPTGSRIKASFSPSRSTSSSTSSRSSKPRPIVPQPSKIPSKSSSSHARPLPERSPSLDLRTPLQAKATATVSIPSTTNFRILLESLAQQTYYSSPRKDESPPPA